MNKNVNAIIKKLSQAPLSLSLGKALRLAERVGDSELARWCRLELGGYDASNPAMSEDVLVPKYRTVTGTHSDIYGQILVVPIDIDFVNETRLRNGVEELETLRDSRDTVAIHNPGMCDQIKQNLEVEVYAFRFSAIHLVGILSAIRMELGDKLAALPIGDSPDSMGAESMTEEILELRPNIYGVGLDLRALWRKWKSTD